MNQFSLLFDTTPTSNQSGEAIIAITATVDTNAVGQGAILCLASDGNYDEADADAATTHAFALAMEAGTGTKKLMLQGIWRNDAWAWTIGAMLYLSATQGTLTETPPSTTGQQIQPVARALSADVIYFNPSLAIGEV